MTDSAHVLSSVVVDTWPEDEQFLSTLQDSWTRQYAEYLGHVHAQALIKRLLDSGALYPVDDHVILLARWGQKKVGMASLRKLQGGLSLITMLEVIPDWQNQGVGRYLLDSLQQHLHDHSPSSRLMAHVSIHRPWVKAFYERQGFHALQAMVVDHYGHALEFDVLAK